MSVVQLRQLRFTVRDYNELSLRGGFGNSDRVRKETEIVKLGRDEDDWTSDRRSCGDRLVEKGLQKASRIYLCVS